MSLQRGDHLVSSRLGYSHHGLYVGNNQVIHYQGPFSGDESCQVVCTSLEYFTEGKDFRIRHHHQQRFSRDASVDRAYSRLGESRYSLLFNNCEHFVMWCIDDEHTSSQVNRAVTAVATTQAARAYLGHVASASAGTLAASTAATTSAGSATVAALVGVSSAPVLAPIAVGVATAYGVHKLWKWLTD